MTQAIDLQTLDEETAQLVVEEIAFEAEEARSDPTAFLEFVMRAEQTQERLITAPHQRVFFEFVEQYRHCVVLLPIDHSKTFCSATLAMQILGQNPSARGAIVSAAEAQAKKPLDMVRSYIEQSDDLHLVFPNLRRSQRAGDPWNETAMTVERPFGIRDPSLVARGIDSKQILGSRWDFAIIDDILNDENVATPEARDKMFRLLQKDVFGRVDAKKGRIIFINTARHLEDAVQRMAEVWPTLTMRVDGTILIKNAPDFDSVHIRPADDKPADDPTAEYRLVAHDFIGGVYQVDNDNDVPLWPERWPKEEIEKRRTGPEAWLPEVFAQNLMNIPISDTSALCKQAYLDRALEMGRLLKVTGFAWDRSEVQIGDWKNPAQPFAKGLAFHVFTGVDLAVSKQSKAGESCVFSFAIFPHQIRVPLWIDHGKWGAKEIEQKLFDHIIRYQPSGVAVENVAAQELFRQVLVERQDELLKKSARAPIKPFTTDAKKHDPFFGVPALFAEFANGLWAIPNDRGQVRPEVRKWMNQCLQYSPSDHTGDLLMSQYFASELAKKFGALSRIKGPSKERAVGANVRAR